MAATLLLSTLCPLVSGVLLGAVALDPPNSDACGDTFTDQVENCSDTFNNPDSPSWQDQQAFETCNDGAAAALAACLAGNGNDLLDYLDFLDAIKDCMTDWPDGGDSYETCLTGALMIYRFELGLPPIEPCAPDVSPMAALRDAAIALGAADGKHPVQVGTTLTFTVGVGDGGSYNTAGIACIKQAQLIALYRTKDGTVAKTLDADTDTTNGTSFSVPVFANRVVHASEIALVALYFNDGGDPVFAEYGFLKIEDSPISGDFNRDGADNTPDVLDYMESYGDQTSRSDVTDDGQTNTDDMQHFLSDHAD